MIHIFIPSCTASAERIGERGGIQINIRRFIRRYRSDKLDIQTYARRVAARRTQNRAFLSGAAALLAQAAETREGREKLEETIRAFAPEEKLRDKRWKRRIKRDIYFTEFYNRIRAEEYFRYGFENLSRTGRRSYVGEWERGEAFADIKDPEAFRIIRNKYACYQALSAYYKREAVLLSGEADRESFSAFCSRHPCFFAKPVCSSGGNGVRRLQVGQDGSEDELFRQLLADAPLILEEPIRQREEMARFHPQSVNTIRAVTAWVDGKLEIVQTSVRLGVGASVVDNGCLSAGVDTETGIITTPGRAAHTKGLYLRHPDTGVQILGSRIPEWDVLLEQVREQASVFPKQRIIGWDMAYSDKGWIVVEANSRPMLQILAGNGVGMRDVFEKITR